MIVMQARPRPVKPAFDKEKNDVDLKSFLTSWDKFPMMVEFFAFRDAAGRQMKNFYTDKEMGMEFNAIFVGHVKDELFQGIFGMDKFLFIRSYRSFEYESLTPEAEKKLKAVVDAVNSHLMKKFGLKLPPATWKKDGKTITIDGNDKLDGGAYGKIRDYVEKAQENAEKADEKKLKDKPKGKDLSIVVPKKDDSFIPFQP